ncbi:hypothetical protein D917_10809, partial [Trichinella nativa]
ILYSFFVIPTLECCVHSSCYDVSVGAVLVHFTFQFFMQICLTGYIGKKCQFKDPCIENPCKNGGNCTYNINLNDAISLNCSCPE